MSKIEIENNKDLSINDNINHNIIKDLEICNELYMNSKEILSLNLNILGIKE